MTSTDNTARLMHYARVDAVVALSREGQLYELHDAAALEVANALEVLGIRPPCRHVEAVRARFPNLYDTAHDHSDEALAAVAGRARFDYAAELLDLADRVAAYELDPAGAYEAEHDLDDFRGNLAIAGGDTLDALRDELDQLIGESFDPTHSPG